MSTQTADQKAAAEKEAADKKAATEQKAAAEKKAAADKKAAEKIAADEKAAAEQQARDAQKIEGKTVKVKVERSHPAFGYFAGDEAEISEADFKKYGTGAEAGEFFSKAK